MMTTYNFFLRGGSPQTVVTFIAKKEPSIETVCLVFSSYLHLDAPVSVSQRMAQPRPRDKVSRISVRRGCPSALGDAFFRSNHSRFTLVSASSSTQIHDYLTTGG